MVEQAWSCGRRVFFSSFFFSFLFFSRFRSPPVCSASSHPTSPPLNGEGRGSAAGPETCTAGHSWAGTLDLEEDLNEWWGKGSHAITACGIGQRETFKGGHKNMGLTPSGVALWSARQLPAALLFFSFFKGLVCTESKSQNETKAGRGRRRR